MGSTFGGTWEDPEGGFIKFAIERFKTRPNTPDGGETSIYSLLQQEVSAMDHNSNTIFISLTLSSIEFLDSLPFLICEH